MDIFLYAHAERTKLRALYPLGRSTLFSYNLTGIPILLHTYQCEKNDIYKLLPQKQHIR